MRKPNKQSKGLQYVMYGKHAVFSAIKNKNREIFNIYATDSVYKSNQAIFSNHDINIVDQNFIASKLNSDHARESHQGIIAIVKPLNNSDIMDLIEKSGHDRIAILDQITDPQNIGAIIRSAAAFGITKIIAPIDGTPVENGAIAKSSVGCLELMQIARVVNLKKSIDTLKKNGYWIAGLDGSGKDKAENLKNVEKLAIIIGSEGKGMRRLTQESCDYTVSIPISDKVESLNAASAASIMFYALGNI